MADIFSELNNLLELSILDSLRADSFEFISSEIKTVSQTKKSFKS